MIELCILMKYLKKNINETETLSRCNIYKCYKQ